MKRLITLIMVGIMLFMVPLSAFAADIPIGNYRSALTALCNQMESYFPGQDYTVWYASVRKLNEDFETNMLICKNGNASFTWGQQSGYTTYGYLNESGIVDYWRVRQFSDGTWDTTVQSASSKWDSSIYKSVKLTPFISRSSFISGGTPTDPYGPDVYNYQINPGDYCRFTKPSGATSADIIVDFEVGNNPFYLAKNYSSDQTVKNFEASPLAQITHTTTDHIDMQLKSTRRNEPITVTSVCSMEKLSTGGNLPPDGTTYTDVVVDDDPNKIVLKNNTMTMQYVTIQRNSCNDGEYHKIQIETMSNNSYVGNGLSWDIKDWKALKFKVLPLQRVTIYNRGGVAGRGVVVSYPVMEGFNVGLYKDTTPLNDALIPGNPVPVEDLPGYIDDGLINNPNILPNDTLALLKWASQQILDFLGAMGTVLVGVVKYLFNFSALFASISFLPPEFTIAFMAMIVVSLALRVVGR